MTKQEAIHAFWSDFGLTAYEETAVPTGDNAPDFPYLTYSVATDSVGNNVGLSASLWYYSKSWQAIALKTEEIAQKIGANGKIVKFTDGALWVRRGSPFAQNMGDSSSDMIRRSFINVTAEFISNN